MKKQNKHLIVNGCSFTNGNFGRRHITWANIVEDHFRNDYTFHQIGYKGNSNDIIIPQTANYIQQFNSNDELIVIVQLTALDRIVVDGKKSPSIGSALKSLNWMKWAMSQNETISQKWRNYFENEYSEEKHITSFINQLLNLQLILKGYSNVKYKIFCGWDILTQNNEDTTMWDLKVKYQNKNDKLISELYEDAHSKFKLLDLDKFWFFENEYIQYGGLSQWVQYNVPTEYWYLNVNAREIDYHPSEIAHREFAEKVMIPLIKEML